MNKVITNKSRGYDFNYASLADIVNEGYNLPVMKTGTEDGREYVFWLMNHPMNISENGVLTDEGCEWVRGAEIIIPESPKNKFGKDKMNAAQLYGTALTYARRYTAMMALGLASEDDEAVERGDDPQEEKKEETKQVKLATKTQIEKIKSLLNEEQVAKMLEYYKVKAIEELPLVTASKVISGAEEKNNGK